MTDNDGCTALYHSARNGNSELFKCLAGLGNDIKIKRNNGWNCLHIVSLYGHVNLCKTLFEKFKFHIEMTDNDELSALHLSVRNGSYKLVTYFTSSGCDIHLKTKVGWNCLHIAANFGHFNLC